MFMKRGTLFVISGPSGCGKGTVLSEVLKDPNLYFSISATTRTKREGEEDGVNYFFLTREDFEALVEKDGVLEYAKYCGNYYGTPKKPIEAHLSKGVDVLLEIEVQGAAKVRQKCPGAILIFLMPPSLSELRRRLLGRGTESAETVEKRIAQASKEIALATDYDYIVINGDLQAARADVKAIIRAARCRQEKYPNITKEVLSL